jgi:putative DNA primase/helicase
LFVEALLKGKIAGELDLANRLAKAIGALEPADDQARRAARIFALMAIAGELATEWDVVPWPQEESHSAAKTLFKRWCAHRPKITAGLEHTKILRAILDFIERHGESRFSSLTPTKEEIEHGLRLIIRDRAGYYDALAGERVYYFNRHALDEATAGYDHSRVCRALREANALARHGLALSIPLPIQRPNGFRAQGLGQGNTPKRTAKWSARVGGRLTRGFFSHQGGHGGALR